MAINFGNDKIKEIYVGSDKIKEVYHGSELVYTAHDPRGYWVHRNTGVKTYFVASGTFSSPSWKNNCSEVKIPDGVTHLLYACFDGCSALASITLPEGITSLATDCFYGCTSLTSITIPESVYTLGSACFANCTALTLATVLPATPPTLGTNAFYDVHASFNIKVRSPYVNAYKTATNWKSYASKISAI